MQGSLPGLEVASVSLVFTGPFLCACAGEGAEATSPVSLLDQGTPPYDLIQSVYLLKVLFSNTVTLGS